MNKVLVGVPCYPGDAHARTEFVTALKNMRGDFDVLIVWNGDEEPWGLDDFTTVTYTPPEGLTGHEILAAKENIMRQRMLDYDYTHLLSLESDNIVKPDTLEQLLSHDQDIVSAIYFIRAQQEFGAPMRELPQALEVGRKHGFDEDTLCYFARNEVIPSVWGIYMTSIGGMDIPDLKSRLWTLEDVIDAQQHKIVPIAGAGVGCVLVTRRVMEKVRFLTSNEYACKYLVKTETHTDYIFYAEALKQGYNSFADPNHIVKHLHRGMANERTKWFGVHAMETERIGKHDDYEPVKVAS